MKQNNEIYPGDRVRFKSWAEVVKIVLIDNNPQYLNQTLHVLQNVRPFCGTEATVEMIGYQLSGNRTFLCGDFNLQNSPFSKAEFPVEFLEKVEVPDEAE